MTLIADILMIAGAMGAAFYCMVLSRRLRRFSDLEKGVGGAVAVLSVQVDDLNRTIRQAEKAAAESAERLNALTARSEDAARRLELMIAAMHDLPIDAEATAEATAPTSDAAAEGARPEKADTAPKPSIFSSRRKLGGQAA
jgi:methyl-accepting chemotaxis protein